MQPYKQPHRLSGRADVALRRECSQAPVSYPSPSSINSAILIKMTDAHASGEIQEPSRTKPQRAWRPDLMLSLESIVALSGVEALRRAVEPRRRSNNPRSKLERNLIR
jgi:hypothetical protein